jgi:hypothetical protein
MKSSPQQRAILPLIALQGAVSTLAGFIGFFVMRERDVNALFAFTALMLTAAVAATFLAYRLGPRLHLTGKRLMKLGFFVPGFLLLTGEDSVAMMALAFGSFVGLTWGARHWLEMSLLADAERDSYAARAGALTVVFGIAATFGATLVLTHFAEDGRLVYLLYAVICLAGGFFLGRQIPDTPPVSIVNPLMVVKQPEFIACLPFFFLESGLFGVGQAMASAGAVTALHSASHFGWVATIAGLTGGIALHLTRRNRGVDNRAHWLGGSCLVVGLSFIMLGMSAWMPALFIAHSVLKAAGSPFLAASEQVLNQHTLDIRGHLADRIFAREFVLWALRMVSLLLFWGLAVMLSPAYVLAAGSVLLAVATAMEYLAGKNLFRRNHFPVGPAPLIEG